MGNEVLPAAPASCCSKFVTETDANGRKVITTVTPSTFRGKPARELTVTEGRRLVSFLACRGDIELVQRYPAFKCKNDGSLEITSPPLIAKKKFHEAEKGPDGKPTGTRIFDASRDFFAPESVDIKAVVKLKDLPGEPTIALNNLNDTKTPPASQLCLNLDFRNVVGLYKLLEMLVSQFGATEMLHAGIGSGIGPATDCHNTGRAIDFSGLKGVTKIDADPAATYDIRVLQDWGQKRILDRSGNPTGQQQGNVFFWADGEQSFFRLISQGVPAPSPREQLAINIFTAIYDFAREQYVEHGFQRGPGSSATGPVPATVRQTQIGDGSFILQPDARDGNSLAHTNHMHFQIGPTGIEDNFNSATPAAGLGDPKS